MSEIKLNINAPITNITIASSINTQQYIQSKSIENKDSSEEEEINVGEKENPLIFDEVFLNSFYLAFNNLLWKNTDIESFKNWFRVNPVGAPEFIIDMTTYFCYAFSKIEDKIIKEYKPKNLNNWIRPVINGNNYSHMKNLRDNEEKIVIIDNKLSLILN